MHLPALAERSIGVMQQAALAGRSIGGKEHWYHAV
jgi:hypothetical protein